MSDDRYIPADIRRAVLTEAGHCCAIPTCGQPVTEYAHIEPFSKVRRHEVSNIIALCPNHHTAYDRTKSIDRKSMRIYKMKLQILNGRYTRYEMRLLAALSTRKLVPVAGEFEVAGLMADGLVENAKTLNTRTLQIEDSVSGTVSYDETFVTAFAARMTDKGMKFVAAWKSDDADILNAL